MMLFDGHHQAPFPPMNYRFFHTMVDNIPRSLAHPHIGQHPTALAGIPALILAAGPSLHESIAALGKTNLANLVIFAVDAALIPAMQSGVTPHFIVTCDQHRGVSAFLPPASSLPDTALIYEISAGSETIIQWCSAGGRAIVTGTDSSGFAEVYHCTERGLTAGAGSVTSIALGIAHRLGCNPILLGGADLCWDHGQPTHAAGSPGMMAAHQNNPRINIKFKDRTICSSWYFFVYKKLIEQQCKEAYNDGFRHYRVLQKGIIDIPAMGSFMQFQPLDSGRIAEIIRAPTDWTPDHTDKAISNLYDLLDAIAETTEDNLLDLVPNLCVEYFTDTRNDKAVLIQESKEYLTEHLKMLQKNLKQP